MDGIKQMQIQYIEKKIEYIKKKSNTIKKTLKCIKIHIKYCEYIIFVIPRRLRTIFSCVQKFRLIVYKTIPFH